jgi:hypothetical protein
MVEIFTKRSELMPSDESAEQHKTKGAEELADVEKDKNGPDGLFKGVFPAQSRELKYDEADGVWRCPGCLAEHEGGPTCSNCGSPVDSMHDFSDMDEVDFDDFEDDDGMHHIEFDVDDMPIHPLHPHMMGAHYHPPFMGPGHYHIHHYDISEQSDSYDSEGTDESDSLNGFVVNDEEPDAAQQQQQSRTITISDDESDEDDVVPRGRSRRMAHVIRDSSPSANSVFSVSSSRVADVSEDANEHVDRLLDAGWSPLHQTDESESEAGVEQVYYNGYDDTHHPRFSPTSDEDEGESDTETMVGNGGSDDELRVREGFSETPRYESEEPRYDYEHYGSEPSEDENTDDDDIDHTSILDEDGDTEMSVSGLSRSPTRSISADSSVEAQIGFRHPYSAAESSDEEEPTVAQELGPANQMHEIEDDSSDSSTPPRPPPRRRPRQYRPNMLNQFDNTGLFDDFRMNHDRRRMLEEEYSTDRQRSRPRRTLGRLRTPHRSQQPPSVVPFHMYGLPEPPRERSMRTRRMI